MRIKNVKSTLFIGECGRVENGVLEIVFPAKYDNQTVIISSKYEQVEALVKDCRVKYRVIGEGDYSIRCDGQAINFSVFSIIGIPELYIKRKYPNAETAMEQFCEIACGVLDAVEQTEGKVNNIVGYTTE